jgi:hypothetical protein
MSVRFKRRRLPDSVRDTTKGERLLPLFSFIYAQINYQTYALLLLSSGFQDGIRLFARKGFGTYNL